MIEFRCNICGAENQLPEVACQRETGFCTCGANSRFRGVVLGLTLGLYGKPQALCDLAEDQHFSGIGFSDTNIYAKQLARLFAYVNTFLDRTPSLDLCNPATVERYLPADFVICSDVLEHVAPPISACFATLHRLLRPGGLLVLSVPSYELPITKEHFPDYHDAALVQLSSGPVLVNRRRDGGTETFDDLVFHGGEGATLEMRRFARVDVLAGLREAGFTDILPLAPDRPELGYCWPTNTSVPGEDNYGEIVIARAAARSLASGA